MALLHLYRPFHYRLGSFTSMRPPGRDVRGGLRRLSRVTISGRSTDRWKQRDVVNSSWQTDWLSLEVHTNKMLVRFTITRWQLRCIATWRSRPDVAPVFLGLDYKAHIHQPISLTLPQSPHAVKMHHIPNFSANRQCDKELLMIDQIFQTSFMETIFPQSLRGAISRTVPHSMMTLQLS